MNYTARQKNLANQLQRIGVEALLVTHLPNIRYLCGFTGTAGVLVLNARAASSKLVGWRSENCTIAVIMARAP